MSATYGSFTCCRVSFRDIKFLGKYVLTNMKAIKRRANSQFQKKEIIKTENCERYLPFLLQVFRSLALGTKKFRRC